MDEWTPPPLGTVDAVNIVESNMVLVREFKFDTIRQEAYWATRGVRKFKTRQLAEAYVARVIDTQTI